MTKPGPAKPRAKNPRKSKAAATPDQEQQTFVLQLSLGELQATKLALAQAGNQMPNADARILAGFAEKKCEQILPKQEG